MNTQPYQPMLATLGKPPCRYADFAVEAKYDGQRGLEIVDGGTVMLLSRNGCDITRTFPEITAALPIQLASQQVVLDGEIVALGTDGVPSFSSHRAGPTPTRRWCSPPRRS